MSSVSWKAHFTQPISGYDPVEAQGLSELGYALLHRQIPEEEYLKWARENFELSSIDMKFFQTISAPREVYEKLKDAYAWGPECLPVGEWEEYVLVAGLQKPDDIPPELKPIFLLAPVNGLLKYWSQFSDEESKPLGEEGESAELGGMPEGFNLDATVDPSSQATGLSFSGVSLATTHTETATEAKEEKKAEPISIQIGEDTGIKPLVKSDILKPASATPGVQTSQPVSTSSYTMPPLNPKVPPPPSSNIAIPKIPAQAEVPADTLIVQNPPAETLENTVPEIKAQPQIVASTKDSGSIEASIPEDSIKEVFELCRKHYEKQLYVEFNDAKKTAVAKYWPHDFVATETPSEYSLQEDSFLAIVAKTQKSYHGYVVKNSVSERFFKEVNSGQLPENMTMVPLMKNDVVVGAVMGWGPKSTYNLSVLRDMEKTVNDLCLKLGWVQPEAA